VTTASNKGLAATNLTTAEFPKRHPRPFANRTSIAFGAIEKGCILLVAQGRSYFVRTVTLKSGKNRFEILVDGERVRRATYSR
jgi:hypothetical protein